MNESVGLSDDRMDFGWRNDHDIILAISLGNKILQRLDHMGCIIDGIVQLESHRNEHND